jgi:hypothetical protein
MMGFSLIAAGSEVEASLVAAAVDAMTGRWVVKLIRWHFGRTSGPYGGASGFVLTISDRRGEGSMVGRRRLAAESGP